MSDDLISRQAAIDAMELLIKDLRKDTVDVMNFGHNYNHGVADAIATLKHLPSAERHGRWEHLGGDEWFCTACAHVITTEGSWERPCQKYCEECGAKMEAKENENN